MRKLISYIIFIVVLINCGAAMSQEKNSWDEYFRLSDEEFYYGDYSNEEAYTLQKRILESIINASPQNWLAYYELSRVEESMGYYYYLQNLNTDDFELYNYGEFFEASNVSYKMAKDMVSEIDFYEIETLSSDAGEKGRLYYAYAKLSDDKAIKQDSYIKAYQCLQESDAAMIPLFQLMYDSFSTDNSYVNMVFRTWNENEEYYTDKLLEYLCRQFIIQADRVLVKDLNAYLKAQIYQCMLEANSYLAYCSYYQNELSMFEELIKDSEDLLNKRFEYGDVTGGRFVQNDVPVCMMYDAHLRALYSAKVNDKKMLSKALKDYSIAEKSAFQSLEYDAKSFMYMKDSINSIIAGLAKDE